MGFPTPAQRSASGSVALIGPTVLDLVGSSGDADGGCQQPEVGSKPIAAW